MILAYMRTYILRHIYNTYIYTCIHDTYIYTYIHMHEYAFIHTCIHVGLVYTLLRYRQLIKHSSICSKCIFMYKLLLQSVAQAKNYS